MKLIKSLAIAALLLPLGACANNQDTGTLVGGVAGGVIGNQFGHGAGRVLATATGAVVGGLIGNSIGKQMDDDDRRQAMEAEYRALESDDDREPVRWRNERSGHSGYIRPRRTYHSSGMRCREFEEVVEIDGRPETVISKACRRPDGTWKIV